MRYKKLTALDNVGFTLKENVICGVLGRNGAGKTTLLSLLAAFRRPTAGTIRVLGENPYENPRVMPQIAFIYDKSKENSVKSGIVFKYAFDVKDILRQHACFRPNWDNFYAQRLCKRFDIPLTKDLRSLSRGQQAAIRVIIGLAGRAPVTIFDEAHLGMDAVYRKLFISEILDDYMQHPRMILFSTHHIDEVDKLFSEVIILDNGRIAAHEDCDSLRQKGVVVTGNIADVDFFTQGRQTLFERSLGTQKEKVLFGALTETERAAAEGAGLVLSAPSLQDLFIYMTEKGGRNYED